MRSRRRRGSREPVKWARTSYLEVPFQVSADATGQSLVPLWQGTQFETNPASIDEEYTLLRVVLNRHPVACLADSTLLTSSFVLELTWFIYVDVALNAEVLNTPFEVFSRKKDIIAGGTEQAAFYSGGPDQAMTPPWQLFGERNWIDTKINRRLTAADGLYIWMTATIKPNCGGGANVTPGVEEAPCWVCDFDVSLLYKRGMRRR